MIDLMKELKGESIRHTAATTFLFLIAGAVLICISGIQYAPKMLHPSDLQKVTSLDMEGSYVEGNINYLYGEYMETASYKDDVKKDTESVSMIIFPGSSNGYIGVEIPKNQIDAYEAALESCYSNYDNSNYTINPAFHVSGTIVKMSSEEQQYYQDFLNQLGADGSDTQTFAPYVLKVGCIGDSTPLSVFIVFGLGLLLVMVFVFQLIRALRGYYQKDLDAFITSFPDQNGEYRKISEFYHTVAPVNGIYVNNEYVMFQDGKYSRIYRPWDIVWIYKEVTHHKMYGFIPTGDTFAFKMAASNGNTYTFTAAKNNIDAVLETLSKELPGAVTGYTPELFNQYRNDRESFSQKWNELRK